MTWPLLEVIDAHLDEPWCKTLATHLGHFSVREDERELRLGRRYAVARRLAGLFDSYARRRPQLLAAWLDGDNPSDEGGLDDDLAWQPELWRRLVGVMGIDPPHIHGTPKPLRNCRFGRRTAAAADLAVRLHQAVLHRHRTARRPGRPSRGAPVAAAPTSNDLWTTLSDLHGVIPRNEDIGHRVVGHPLLATLGRDLRELQRALPRASDEFLPVSLTRTPCWAGCRPAYRHRQYRCTAGPFTFGTGPIGAGAQLSRSGSPGRRAAQCCSACSPTTRPWNPATSW